MKTLRRTLSTIIALAFLGCATSQPPVSPQEPTLPLAWVEMGPESKAWIRAVSQDAALCPNLTIDGQPQKMSTRSTSTPEFPIRVCELEVPAGAQKASIGDIPLTLPKANPSRIIVLGDTGCRMKVKGSYREIQDCNDPSTWPFQRIAQISSQWKPDLIIHVGDYLYRESPCPPQNKKCTGSPWGDDWASWKSDFFSPGEALLRSAPWVFVRGNHELCSRAGQGYAKLLDPFPYSNLCIDNSPPYSVSLGQRQLVVMDTANAEDHSKSKDLIRTYTQQFKKLNDMKLTEAWIATHRPFWYANVPSNPSLGRNLLPQNEILEQAAQKNLPEAIRLIFSGHIHLFKALAFTDDGPSEIIVGNGGALLVPSTPDLKGVKLGNRTVKNDVGTIEYGFLTLELAPDEKQWKGIVHDPQGRPVRECTISGAQIDCKAT